MNKKKMFASLLARASVFASSALLVLAVSALAQTTDPAASSTTTGEVLPAKTKAAIKAARPFTGALFANKVLIGTVTQVSGKVITVTQEGGAEADITTTEVTKFVKGGRKINLSGMSVGDTLYAVGASSTDGTFLAERVVARSKVLKQLKKVPFYGQVTQVGAKSFTLVSKSRGETVEVLVNATTVIKQTGKKVALSAVTPGARVVVIALSEDDGTYTGKMVQILPQVPVGKAEGTESTPSVTAKP